MPQSTLAQPRRIDLGQPPPRPLDRRQAVLGRLISLSSSTSGTMNYLASDRKNEGDSAVVIHFPSMPEVVQLARKAEYRQTSAPYTPDGLHLYKQTHPLEIPISFSLHYKDPFCSKGGLSLLVMASKLHSLVLPINSSPDRFNVSASVDSYYQAAQSGQSESGRPAALPQGASSVGTPAALGQEPSLAFRGAFGQSTTAFPPACLLDLISIGDRTGSPGIRCYGYVSSVDVKLKGPWLRGAQESGPQGIRNVPTSAEFSFVFVHAPGFTNYFGGASFNLSGLSAFSGDVLENFYNTVSLTEGHSRNDYIGVGDQRAAEIPQTQVVNPPKEVLETDQVAADYFH